MGCFIQFSDSDSDFVQWLRVKDVVTNIGTCTYLLVGCIYIPQENTKYSSKDAFIEIKNEMFIFSINDECICRLGDFNVKTGILQDFVQPDESIVEILIYINIMI